MSRLDIDPETEWENFWLPILVSDDTRKWLEREAKDDPEKDYEGVLRWAIDLEQLKRELADFSFLIRAIPIVYDEITSGRCSKPTTDPHTVIALEEERMQEAINDALVE